MNSKSVESPLLSDFYPADGLLSELPPPDRNDLKFKKRPLEVSLLRLNLFDVPPTMPSSGLEPETSPLPRECSTAELQGLVEMMGRVGFEPT